MNILEYVLHLEYFANYQLCFIQTSFLSYNRRDSTYKKGNICLKTYFIFWWARKVTDRHKFQVELRKSLHFIIVCIVVSWDDWKPVTVLFLFSCPHKYLLTSCSLAEHFSIDIQNKISPSHGFFGKLKHNKSNCWNFVSLEISCYQSFILNFWLEKC